MSIEARAEAEVRELHRFFVDWYRGALPTEAFARLETVLADGFTLRAPQGETLDRQQVIGDVFAARGAAPVAIRIENCRLKVSDPITFEYEEWQVRDGVERGRTSVAVFAPAAGTPHGLAWVSVVETKLAGWD